MNFLKISGMNNEDILKRISNHLIINTSSLDSIGLYHGKMGVVLFFVNYARLTNNNLYHEFAGELLNEVYNEIRVDIPIDFENGLCGIGCGIEYLLQYNFMEGDSDEILFDIDEKIMERDLTRIIDVSLETGLLGILYYIDKRLSSSHKKTDKIRFDSQYLLNYEKVKAEFIVPREEEVLTHMLSGVSFAKHKISDLTLGLHNGCAGYGLKLILT